jgi:hypothetical protein
MTTKTFEEIREYYFCILKVRLGVHVYDGIINDVKIDNTYDSIKDKYNMLSQMPNHIHIISLINKFRTNVSDVNNDNNELLLRSMCLLCKFHDEFNSDFKLKSEPDMMRTLLKLFSEYEYMSYSNNDKELG